MRLEGKRVPLEPLALWHVPALVEAASESRDTYAFADVPDGAAGMAAYVREALETLYDAERAFIREHGLEPLEQRFETVPLDYLDPFRKPVV